MSKYDNERKKLGLTPVGSTSSASSTTKSKYADEREGLTNSLKKAQNDHKVYEEGMKKSRLMEIETNQAKQSKYQQEREEMEKIGMDFASQNAKPPSLSRAGLQHIVDTQPVKPALPSYGERIRDRLSDFPTVLQPLVAPIAALEQAPFMVSARQGLGTTVGKEDQYEFGKGAQLAGDVLNTAGSITFSGSGGTGLYNAAGNVLSRIAPNLGNTSGGRIASTAIKGVAEGVPAGVGQELAINPEASAREFAVAGALGAGGGLIPAAGRAVVESARGLRNVASRGSQPLVKAVGGELDVRVPETPVRSVSSRELAQNVESDAQLTTPGRSTKIAPEPPTLRSPRIQGERGFVQNLEQSGKLTPEVERGLAQSPERRYEPITNEETVARANQRISQGVDQAEADLLGKNKYNADDVATGMRLIDELQKGGNVQRAVTIAENLSKALTEAGQTVQAASIWNRLTPEGALLAAQRKVNRVNDNLLKGQQEVKISNKQAQDIIDAAGAIQASGGSQERAGTVMEIMDRARKGETLSTSDKQTIADFIDDARRFVKKSDGRPPKQASAPKEMSDKRVADRVVSFLEAQEQAAKERLRSKGVRVSSNPLDIWADYAYIGALKLAKGATKFADWSAQMISDFGEEIRPQLRNIYEKAQSQLSNSAKQINEQVVSRAERIAEGYLKSNADKLSDGDVTLIRDLAQKVSSLAGKERNIASQDLQAIMQGFEKAGIGRKLSTVQYISMLLNPKSQIRNIVGNELMYRFERLSRLIGTPIDIVASKVTGGPRTVTFKSGPRVWDNFFTTSKDFYNGLIEGGRAGSRGVSPEGLTTKYDIQGPAFTSKYNPLTYMEKALGATMQGFDYAAFQRATNQRMREMAYLDAINSGVKGADNIRDHMQSFMTNLDEGVHNLAKEYGKYATLQDDTLLARKLLGFRRGVNQLTGSKDFGVGSLVVPFAKTPANLLLRGLEYSPAGILKAVKQTHEILRKKNTSLTRADVIDSVSRTIMGSGMGVLAYWLADKGALFGKSNDDPEVRKLQQQTGIKDFQINGSALSRMVGALVSGGDVNKAAKLQPGDTLWGYSWAQPTATPIAVGSNVYQGVKEGQSGLKTAGEAALSGLSTVFDSSVLSGIREAFQVPSGEDNAIKAIGTNLIKQAPNMFTPSILKNINAYLDDRVKETYSPDTADSYLNPAKSGIPGLAQDMPQRVSTLGEPQTRPNSFFDIFVTPADRSKYKPTKEAQLVMDLLNETGDNRLAPRAVDKYLSGKDSVTGQQKKVNLSPEQYVQLQTIVGQETAKRISQINTNLPTDKKVELVLKAFDDAGRIGRNALKRELGIREAR
ncbi:hypothetical protein [Cohnella sp. GCM10027633]|uniref:hypothetical protein n=1 Tax=unclassified Cohnella TaxID=2636738 RepID=UPI0036292C83